MLGSLLKRFPLFGFYLPVSSLPNFRPDTGGRRWSLVQVASSVALGGGAGVDFPSLLLRLPAALYGACPALRRARFQPSGVPQKRRLSGACVLCLPRPSSSGSQELDGRTLPGCGAPSPLRVPSPSPYPVFSLDPPGGCRPSRISGGLWLETGGLFAVW